MRILYVITSLRIGGAEKLISDIVPRLRDLGHQVDVCSFDGVETDFSRVLMEKNIKIVSFGENCNVYNPLFIFRLCDIMRGYDIVHTHNTAPQLFCAIANCLSNCCIVTTEHSTSNKRRNTKLLKYIDRWMYGRYKRIICISSRTKDNLLSYLGHINTSVIVIPNGLDVKKYQNAEKLCNSLKKNEKTIITMVAGFRYQKDYETLVRAVSHLNKDKYEAWFVGDGQRRNLIENCIRENRVCNNVRLWGVRNDIPSILKSSDIIVQSSHIEGFGLAAVEGMAAQKPVIASNVDGLREVVEGYGILFPHGDDNALASIIERLSEDKEYYQQVAGKCWERAQMFDIQKMVDRYNDVYMNLSSNNG